MKLRQFLNKLKISSTEIPIIITCFGLTILISLVYYNYGSIKTTCNTVVEIKNDGKMVATEKDGHPLRNFTVKITAKSAEKIDESDIHAFVDLRSRVENGQYIAVTDEGEYDFPIIIELASSASLSDFTKFEYSPKTVKLKVERKTEEWIKIVPTFSGSLGTKGFEISEKVLTPNLIKISGGRSIVEKAKAEALTTEAIDVSKITNKYSSTTFEVTPNISTLDSRLSVDIKPDTVFTLAVKLAPIQGQQNYENVSVAFSNLKDGLQITNSNISVSISLKGSELNLEKINPATISVIADCVSVTGAGEYEIPITVISPSGTSVLDQPQTVKIWVTEIPVEKTEVNVPAEEYEPEVLEKIETVLEPELEEVTDLEIM